MITLYTQQNTPCDGLQYTYAQDENEQKYYILQVGTSIQYVDAVDVMPCVHTYQSTEIIVPSDK